MQRGRLISDDLCDVARVRADWADAGRRLVYLLRVDVDVPVSADPRVTARTDATNGVRLVVRGYEDDQANGVSVVDAAFGYCESHGDDSRLSFLGFDVCDGVLYSALLNCGYGDDAKRGEAMNAWADKLSEHHLLRELADARDFQRAADARVVEHAPFFVLRVYAAMPA